MYPTSQLSRGEKLISRNGRFTLELDTSGDLVLYTKSIVLWTIKTAGKGDRFVMLFNGNAVLYDDQDNELFTTNTLFDGRYLRLEDNGKLALYGLNFNITWSTNTAHCN